jgi:hypothetical protein
MPNTVTFFDASTGDLVEREATAQELAEQKEIGLQEKQALEAQEARVAARQSALAKLKALGLTEAEIAAL